jgi:group I intron endonuclease
MELSKQQQVFLTSVLDGKNVFLTGKAGTGKSALIDPIAWKIHNKASGIYLIKWHQNGAFYIGQSKDMHCRKRQHLCDFNNNRHDNSRLQNNFNKYGVPDFYCLLQCSSELLNSVEQYLIDVNINDANFCNVSTIASTPFLCPIAIAKAAKTKTGRPLSGQHKASISGGLIEAYKNGRTTNLGGIGCDNPFFGKKHTQETKNHLSQVRKGLLAGGKNGRAIKVKNINTGEIFQCVKDAALSIGLNTNYLRNRISGRQFNDSIFTAL